MIMTTSTVPGSRPSRVVASGPGLVVLDQPSIRVANGIGALLGSYHRWRTGPQRLYYLSPRSGAVYLRPSAQTSRVFLWGPLTDFGSVRTPAAAMADDGPWVTGQFSSF